MQLDDGAGWTLLEKGPKCANLRATGALQPSQLSSASTNVAAKLSDVQIRTFMLAGDRELIIMRPRPDRYHDQAFYTKERFTISFVNNWSSNLRYNQEFEIYNFGASQWQRCNGHFNNYKWSTYCDNGGIGDGPDSTGGTSYFYFHTNTYHCPSGTASDAILFYFK